MSKLKNIEEEPVRSADLPKRSGMRPKTIRAPLHIQCNGHGDRKYLNQLIKEIRDWPDIESNPPFVARPDILSIRLIERAIARNASTFITGREFARVLLAAPTIYLALPLPTAHWAIVRGWAEPHYLGSHGLMPAGVVVLYTPRDEEERAVCSSLCAESYYAAIGTSMSLTLESARRRERPEESDVHNEPLIDKALPCEPYDQ